MFNDFYTIAYEVIDESKKDHEILKLYKGSHLSPQPYPLVGDFGAYFAHSKQGILSFICSLIKTTHPKDLSVLKRFDEKYAPRISMDAAFKLFYDHYAKPGETPDTFLEYICSRKHRMGAYRGGSSGLDDEASVLAAMHFNQLGLSITPRDIIITSGGFKGAMLAMCAAIMCHHEGENISTQGGTVLVPEGYYQSLRIIPPLFGGGLDVLPKMSGNSVYHWLYSTKHIKNRIIYVPLVNNVNGDVLTRKNAYSIAEVILTHNKQYPSNPVFVIGDDVYVGSYINTDAQPIGAVSGSMLGKSDLGRMTDWTLSIVTPSKTFALPTSRIAFATTTNQALRVMIEHYRTILSHSRVPQQTELMAAAAIALTPEAWISGWNREYSRRLSFVKSGIDRINHKVSFTALDIKAPEAGWYVPLKLSKRVLPSISTNISALSTLLHYGQDARNTGLGLLSGELFGHMAHNAKMDHFLFRGSVAISESDLKSFVARLEDFIMATTGSDREAVIKHCLDKLASTHPSADSLARELIY